MVQGIKNVIFDFGGIIVDLNKQATIDAFKDLGFDATPYIGKYVQGGFFSELENGNISVEEFCKQVREGMRLDCSDNAIKRAWSSMLIEIPTRRLQFIRSLATRYDVYLLSNTNEIHWDYACKELLASSDIKMYEPFKKIYLSHELHLSKPDLRIFNYVLDDAGLEAGETLFVDDSKDNCDAASEVGITTFHSVKSEDWMRIFDKE